MDDKSKIVIINDSDKNIKTTYDCKGKTGICIPDTWKDFEENAFKGSSAKGTTIYITIYMCVDHDDQGHETWKDVKLTFKNYDKIEHLYFLKKPYDPGTAQNPPVYPDDYAESQQEYYDFVVKDLTVINDDALTATGSAFDDNINLDIEDEGYTIKAGAGNDRIKGTKGTDIITGGTGENLIEYTPGNDHIVLTKGETMTLDLRGIDYIKDSIYSTMDNGNVIMHIGENDTVIFDNFIKSNVVGTKGAVQYQDGFYDNPQSFDNVKLHVNTSDLTISTKKKTASFSGTRFDDVVKIDAEEKVTVGEKEIDLRKDNYKFSIKDTAGNNEITLSNVTNTSTITTGAGNDKITVLDNYNSEKAFTTTINAGAGTNTVTVDTDTEEAATAGNYSIVTGKDNDTINLDYTSTTTIKAGGGENTININTAEFGEVTLAEEKIKGTTNNIVFDDGINLQDYDFVKLGNDLVISSKEEDDTMLTVKGQFLTGGKYSTKTYNDDTFSDFLANNGLSLSVTGSGTVKGTDLSEYIVTTDALGGKAKNDKIYAGKGNDTINAGDGKNQLYFYAGDGIDTVENGGGSDTLVFKKGTKYSLGFADTGNSTEDSDEIFDLRVYYNKNSKEDYVNIKNAIIFDGETYHFDKDATSVTAIKVGSKSYKLESLLNRNKIENVVDKNGNVVGTAKHDDIYVTDRTKFKDAAEVTINGNVGNDYIMIGSNQSVDEENDIYNVDPVNYDSVDIKPTVYTHTTDGAQDITEGAYDKIVSYANNGGTYWGQSAISDIKVYGIDTDDTYNTYYNNQFTKLYDESGDNDVLNIKDKAHSDLKLIFNITKDYKDWGSEIAKIETITEENKHDVVSLMVNSLQEVKFVTEDDRSYFLESPDENNDIGIDIDYWGDKAAHDGESEIDEKTAALLLLGKEKLAKFGGGIEKIVASDGWYITSGDIADVASEVVNWLNNDATYGGQFDSVEDVFGEKGIPEAQAALLAVFDNVTWTNGNLPQ